MNQQRVSLRGIYGCALFYSPYPICYHANCTIWAYSTDNITMVENLHAIVNFGDLPSLVATAMVASQPERPEIALIHIRDGRVTRNTCSRHMQMQAEHYDISNIHQVNCPHLNDTPIENLNELPAPQPLVQPQLLLAAISEAMQLEVARIIWPIQIGEDFDQISATTEQLLHTRMLAEADIASQKKIAAIDTPLIDLTDRQLVELGSELQCPWQLAWSCLMDRQTPCRACATCKKRQAGFAAAGINDFKINVADVVGV